MKPGRHNFYPCRRIFLCVLILTACQSKINVKTQKGAATNSKSNTALTPQFNSANDSKQNASPTWTWKSAGNGTGKFRVKLDSGDFSSGYTEISTTSFTPTDSLTDGSHILYIQEMLSDGTWSNIASQAITIDAIPPNAPVLSASSTTTSNSKPTWTWVSGGGDGSGTYRYKLDSSDLTSGATSTTSLTYTPSSALSEGTHTLFVQERDAVNNWSSSGRLAITIDLTAPTISITTQPDVYLRAGDTQTMAFSVSDYISGVASLTWAYAEDGSTYGSATSLATNATSMSFTVPSNANSSINAKIKLVATDNAGNARTTISSAFQIVTKVSEIYRQGYYVGSNAGGTASNTRMMPTAIANDGTYLYTSDGNIIRRSALSDGTTIAIAGWWQQSGTTDGVNTAARFNNAAGLVTLGTYLYVADTGNHTVRRIDVDPNSANFKTVTTFAGLAGTSGTTDGTGTNARFNTPRGIATDGTYIYVGDQAGQIIRRIDPSTGVVTTIAGTAGTSGTTDATGTAAKFNGPYAMVYDSGTASLYIAESGGLDIRKLVIATGAVTTLSGSGHRVGHLDGNASTAHFRFPSGITTDGTYLYICDLYEHVIRKISIANGDVTTVSGTPGYQYYAEGNAATALYSSPRNLTYYNGDLYIADTNNFVIRKLNTTTFISTLFIGAPYGTAGFDPKLSAHGSQTASFEQIFGMTTTDGNIFYVTQFAKNTIRKIDISNNTTTTIAGTYGDFGTVDGTGTAAKFNAPMGIVKVGNYLYVSDSTGNSIRQIDLSNNAVATIAGSTAGTSGTADDATGTNARFSGPRGLDSDGTYIYVADYGNHRIRRITIGGTWTVTTIAGSSSGFTNADNTSAQFNNPNNVTVSGNTLYVSDTGNHAIRQIDISNTTYTVTTVAGTGVSGTTDGVGTSATFNSPGKLVVNGTDLYVGDSSNSRIRKIDLTNSNTVSTVLGGSSYSLANQAAMGDVSVVSSPDALVLYNGIIYFANAGGYGIQSYTISNRSKSMVAPSVPNNSLNFKIVYGSHDGALSETAYLPAGVVSDGTYLYTASAGDFTVRRMNMDGSNVVVIAGAAGAAGHVDHATGTSARFSMINSAPCIDSNYLYILDKGSNTIRRVALTGSNTVDTLAGSAGVSGSTDGVGTAAKFGFLGDCVVIGSTLYFSDYGNHTIRKVALDATNLGTVTTIAGTSGTSGTTDGAAASALFNRPNFITAIGNVLYIQEANNTLRKFDLTGNTVAILAGGNSTCDSVDAVGTSAKFCGLSSIASDGQSYIYANDSSSGLVRKIKASDGTVTTFFGVLNEIRDDGAGSISGRSFYSSRLYFIQNTGLTMTVTGGYNIKILN